MTATPAVQRPITDQTPSLPRAAAKGWAIAMVGNIALLLLATLLLGVDVVHPDPPGSDTLGAVTAVHVAMATTVGALLGLAAAALAARFSPKPRATFLTVAGLGAAVSMGGPFSITGASAASTAVLLAMHLIAPAALLPLLARALPRERARR